MCAHKNSLHQTPRFINYSTFLLNPFVRKNNEMREGNFARKARLIKIFLGFVKKHTLETLNVFKEYFCT